MTPWFRTITTLLTALLLVVGVAPSQPAHAQSSDSMLLSAFFGLDNALPAGANGLCRRAAGQDGMPVIFSTTLNPDTVQAEDFAVIRQSGAIVTPMCATFSPAVDPGELRTVLLIGEFGNVDDDPPVQVEITGDILSSGEGNSNAIGSIVEVTPLSAGPSLINAERVPVSQWRHDQPSGRQQGNGCPSAATLQAVRVTWAGGITTMLDEEPGTLETSLYRVTLRLPDGSQTDISPFVLADLGDGDNNHLLCLDVRGEPVSVFFPEGYLYDPNADAPNPDTLVTVQILAQSTPQTYRDVRYCEIIPTYRRGITLVTEIWNTLGLNDCPADQWAALDGEALQAELGAISFKLNGPRYWVLDEIAALGGVTAAGIRTTFGTIEMEQRAVLETRVRGDLVGDQLYTPNTVQRDTRYVFYAGEFIYTLSAPNGDVYVMQSYSQIIDPALTIGDLEALGERLQLPEGWTYQPIQLNEDFILLSGGETTVIQDDFLNTYQRTNSDAVAHWME